MHTTAPLGAACPVGTDTADCEAAAHAACQYADDSECDEGPARQYCLPGTDFNDCCESVGAIRRWPDTYDDGRPHPLAGQVLPPKLTVGF